MPIDERFGTGHPREHTRGISGSVRSGRTILLTEAVSVNEDGTPVVPEEARARASSLPRDRRSWGAGPGRDSRGRHRRPFLVTCIDPADDGRAHRGFFGDHAPRLTMVEVARLMSFDLLVEVEADVRAR